MGRNMFRSLGLLMGCITLLALDLEARCSRANTALSFLTGVMTGAAFAGLCDHDDYYVDLPTYRVTYRGAPLYAYDYPTYAYAPIYAYDDTRYLYYP